MFRKEKGMKVLNDYGFVRGVCHNPPMDRNWERLERELGYCKRLNINSVRFWMDQGEYEKNPKDYINYIGTFMKICWKYGVTSMPILWNGNFITDFHTPTKEEYNRAEEYARAFIEAFGNEEFIIMWDVINEPMCNDYMHKGNGEPYEERYNKLSEYVRNLCRIVRKLEPVNCITVGHEAVEHCKISADLVDVISYHDYLSTRKEIEGAILKAKSLSEEYGGKPILNTETGCVGRANPYDIELEMAYKHNVGWYLFNLISEGFWGDIHGIVYPDGTIRDPAVIGALFGFFRNRSEDRIKVNANKEGHAYRAVKAVEDVLRVEPTTLFMSKAKTTDDILEAAEYCVNILEAAEMVPMWNPPSARIQCWRNMPEEKRDVYEIKRFAYEMAQEVKKHCMF